jgi:hypothetical protein
LNRTGWGLDKSGFGNFHLKSSRRDWQKSILERQHVSPAAMMMFSFR